MLRLAMAVSDFQSDNFGKVKYCKKLRTVNGLRGGEKDNEIQK